tara:strand:- start:78 stop:323 length:246 start_codon:yes stop_codon:yes gene_type:complete
MKSKYERIYETQIGNKKIEIRKNLKEYILMYCKSSVKNFNKKAKLIKDGNIEMIIKYCKDLFDLDLTKEQLLYSTNFKNNL